ncbi:CchlQ [Frankia canadensis]|uniref:CchlQ n=1 Tax=Frankia canadensis TaxID=1836972 RepID=UPI000C7C7206|nr:CchlQ [Frankia canadensis]
MDWGTLVATVSGAVIAISGTVLADRVRARDDDGRARRERRQDTYVAFIVAAGVCHTRLRQIAGDTSALPADRDARSRTVLADAGIYDVRERLFLDASPPVVAAGQLMFERLRELRRCVAAGAGHASPAFHDAYHPYLDAVWRYRAAVRAELEAPGLAPVTFGWGSWDGTDRCPVCRQALAGG